MPGSITLSLGGYTIIFALTVILMMAILFGIFFYRQIRRLRNNSTHKEINSTVASELRKKAREIINKKIDEVWAFKVSHFPPLTDCLMIAEHANAPHVCRMIAFDEVFRDIDRQLELINPTVLRGPGESTFSFLSKVKKELFPDLSDELIARIGYLHEWCRFRTDQEFGPEQLSELRDLLKEFVRLLNNNRATLTSLNLVISKSRSLETKPQYNELTSGFSQPIDHANLSRSQEEMPLLGDYHHVNRRY
ncbi:unnamed protein product [Bursaphelenchus okinawaensis]|uniref:Uncharacterized protein n=1 Tax=Bursaphelenchus okinawaensis TaxID=465554 RepID=A0A811JUG1_9BILA|nr:unnamed protein product [Bursaphelenchus okinawaensis]CAG9083771.1 unnamed protein product [Bursaphelenchus okinawaensis]